jgi:hypothetical protein
MQTLIFALLLWYRTWVNIIEIDTWVLHEWSFCHYRLQNKGYYYIIIMIVFIIITIKYIII